MLRRLREIWNLKWRVQRLENQREWTLIEKAAWFCACEMIEGHYIEFGVYKGQSFQAAYHALNWAFEKRIEQTEDPAQKQARRDIWHNLRYVALDSFEGLPVLEGVDATCRDFKKGQYQATEEEFTSFIAKSGVDISKTDIVSGWFSETAKPETWEKLGIKKAAIIWIDGDLYQSARDALSGVKNLIQDGTIIIFDEWYCFRGNPNRGEQRAFREFQSALNDYEFKEFHSEGVWRKSFIACRICGE